MIELTKHIEILLLDNDCVIVPGLGGFIAHYQPAHYEEDEGVFMPPMRTVGFNPQLTMNDGLLTQAYMQTYHTDFPDATRLIAKKVDELKESLYNNGVVEMPGIGVLNYTIYNSYEFHPILNGVLSPTLYALDTLSISPVSLEIIEEPVPTTIKEDKTQTSIVGKNQFHLDTRWLGNAVAVAVAVVLFFVLSVPVENTYVDKGNYASLGTDCLFDAIRSQSMATSLTTIDVAEPQFPKKSQVTPVAVKVEKVAPVAKMEETDAKVTPTRVEKDKNAEVKRETTSIKKEKSPEIKKEVSKKPVVAQSNRKKYHIIVASLATSADAKRMLQNYIQQGYKDASIKEGSGRFRISLCSFADRSAANQKLSELKQADAFKGAWMLTSK